MRAGIVLTLALVTGCTQGGDKAAPAPIAPPPPPTDGMPLAVASGDGVPLRYRVYGSAADPREPVLIFIHGWSGDSSYWDGQIYSFKQRYKVVTLDLAGHGESGITRRYWTMDAYADDVVAVAQRIPQKRLILVGHSMGGAVALQAARRMQDRVIGIVGADAFQNLANPPTASSILELRLAPFRADFPTAMRDYVARTLFRSSSNPELVRRIADDMASAPPGVAVGSIIAMNDMNYSAALADIAVPIVAINSDMGPTDVDRIRIHAPTFRLKLMPGVGHFVMIEDPARFNSLLEETIQELKSGGRTRANP